jgi:DNA-binding SARP family transcriptional activator
MIHCRTLGTVEITVDGNPAPSQLTWRKHLGLLVYLGCSPKLRRTRDHLVGLLWPEKGETAARHSLNEAIRVIRRTGGDGAIVSEAGQIRLSAEVVTFDIAELNKSVAASDWARGSQLVNGDFLEGFSIAESSDFEDWLIAERHRWRRESVQVLLERGEELLAQGHPEAAGKLGERAAQLDPALETATALIMRSLALAGSRTAAIERYEQLARRLDAELGTEPSSDLRALAQRMKTGGKHQAPSAESREPHDSRSMPLIGREGSLKELLTQWDGCRRKGATLVMILGDAGLGKTRLLEELMLRAALEEVSLAHARAVESDREECWMGLRALVRGGIVEFPGVAGGPAEAHASLGKLAGEWLERFPGNHREREMPFSQALTEVLRVSAEERPVLLVIDDAQWLDRESLLALAGLLRDLQSAPLMLVLAAASQPPRLELDSLAEGIGRDTTGAVLQLKPLGDQELEALARWWLPRFNDAEIERLARRVAVDSAGLPLLAVEIFRAVAFGMDVHKLAAWPEPTRTLDHTMPAGLPPSMVAAIRVAFRRLTASAQNVLATASVLREPVSAEALSQATGIPAEELNPALDELEWHRWLAADSRGYSFVARIVRATIERDMLTEGQRRRIRTP